MSDARFDALPIPMLETRSGVRVIPIHDSALVTHGRWILVVSAQVPPDILRRDFLDHVKIGPVEQIRDLVNFRLPGIGGRALPIVPRQLPYHAERSYFELDRSGPHWAALINSAGIAIHLTAIIPGLEIECWAYRG